ncbi:DeoR family transcriptional regulator, partial [mine drainage metagenome]
MSKSRRLLEVLLSLHSRRRFTAAQLAEDLGVSRRTALRYLHELSEMGIPLSSRPGPDGGYLVLQDRILPPLAFTVEEAVSLFFAYQSLEGYGALPFEAELGAVLLKLYQRLPIDAKIRVDRMRQRLRFVTGHVAIPTPHLGTLLKAALDHGVLTVVYHSSEGPGTRDIQPI